MSATAQSASSGVRIVSKALALVKFAAREFGPLIVFLVVSTWFGVKLAIAHSILAVVAEAAWRWRRGEGFTRLYWLVAGLTLTFGDSNSKWRG